MKGYLVNFSGHALCEKAREILVSEYDVVTEAAWPEFRFDEALVQQLHDVIESLPINIDGTVPLTIIVPGQATLAALLMSYLHGILGHFPKICYLEQSEEGLYLPAFEYVMNTQSVRSAGRRFRTQGPRLKL